VIDLARIANTSLNESLGEVLSKIPQDSEEYLELMDAIASMDPRERLEFEHSWAVWGRPKQQPPDWCRSEACGCMGEWTLWLLLAGRAFGKSRTGAEWVNYVATAYPGCRIALIARTAGDYRSVMIEGESGIINTQKPWNKCLYEPSKAQIVWANGSIAGLFSADEPRKLRGPQHHFVWADELAFWEKPEIAWSDMRLGLRLPARPGWKLPYRPRVVVTTTPLPTPFIRELAGRGTKPKDQRTHITTGSTYENSQNLDADYFKSVIRDLEGTRLGRQELLGEILVDVPGALWKAHMIDPYRIDPEMVPAHLKQTVVSIDPNAGGDNVTGIVVCASGPPPGGEISEITEEHESVAASLRKNQRIHGYVLADLSNKKYDTPDKWARAAVRAYHDFDANVIVAESNQGGDMIRYAINTVDPSVPVKLVHATRAKKTRAEPIVALFEQGRIHMVGKQTQLEDQLLTWDPEMTNSPDRLDAMVWGLHHLLGKGKIHHVAAPMGVGTREVNWTVFPIDTSQTGQD
jgi:phage terminase large subunit-like protein